MSVIYCSLNLDFLINLPRLACWVHYENFPANNGPVSGKQVKQIMGYAEIADEQLDRGITALSTTLLSRKTSSRVARATVAVLWTEH